MDEKDHMAENLWRALNTVRPFYILDDTGTAMIAATMVQFLDFRQSNKHVIANDEHPHWRVSTIFLGIPHPKDDSPTEMFETMTWLNGEIIDEQHTNAIAEARELHAAQVARMLTRHGHSKSEHRRLAAQRRATVDQLATDAQELGIYKGDA